jgi:hypothetical protein
VVVAHRDSQSSPAAADLSGTAVLLELARVLAGETQHRSLVLVSTSGSTGAAGATQVAGTLGTPVDAVVVLGDLASSAARDPVIVPWSNGQALAPTLLRNTLSAALGGQAGLRPGTPSFGAQFAHLAFPLSVTEQGPFGALGYPTVLLSLSGERSPANRNPADPARITALGRTVLQTINSIDGGPAVPAPSAYLLFGGKVIPAWAIKMFVLALIIPVLLTMVDGLARARRRGHAILGWIIWVLGAAVPFILAALVVLGARLTGLLSATPPGPLGAGAVPLGGGGIAVMVMLALVIVLGFLARHRLVATLATIRPAGDRSRAGAGPALLLVMCAVALVIWARNPFAAALMVPALHLWMWVLDPDRGIPRPLTAVLVLAGLAPPVLIVLYYALSLNLTPVQLAWNGVLLIAGGYVGLLAAAQWSVLLGCVASVFPIAVRRPRPHRPRPQETPVTVRGPITYAGPGSLGGTESALRR